MAFDLVSVGGYGSGELGDLTVTNANTKINSVAKVAQLIDDTSLYPAGLSYACRIEIEDTDGADPAYSSFTVGAEVLIISAGYSEAAENTDAGYYKVTTITSISGDIMTVDDAPWDSSQFDDGHSTSYAWHVIPIPHFRNVTINSGASLIPSTDAPLVFKCSGTLTLNGGHIDLRSRGLYSDSSGVWADWETEILSDTGKHAGWENFRTKNYLKIGGCDGATFIIAKKLVVADNTSRIGNPQTSGVQFCRGSADSRAGTPENTTIKGGSNILLVAGTIEGFTPAIIAKYRTMTAAEISAGQVDRAFYHGLCRCYIASDTLLRNDEGLYAYDGISNENRLTNACNVHDFGDGSSGSFNATSQVNNYASVTAVDETGQVFTVADKTTNGTELFAVGTLVMVHYSSKANITRTYHGRFFLAKILGINGNDITLDTAASGYQKDVTNYQIQLVTIPRFTNFTLNSEYTAVPKFTEKTLGTAPNTGTAQGGIFAIAVSGTCDISDGQINVEGKGGAARYGSAGLEFIGNAQNRDKLPIGEGHGSVFILANKLVMNANTRIGATYSGANFGGAGGSLINSTPGGGGYSGFVEDNDINNTRHFYGGWGGGEGNRIAVGYNVSKGGYGSNGANTSGNYGCQGAHIMIIADTINGFNMAAISTGGNGGKKATDTSASGTPQYGDNGGAGYGGGGGSADAYGYTSGQVSYQGGGGGYNGSGESGARPDTGATNDYAGGGGSSGWAFIYCNNATYQSTDNISL